MYWLKIENMIMYPASRVIFFAASNIDEERIFRFEFFCVGWVSNTILHFLNKNNFIIMVDNNNDM